MEGNNTGVEEKKERNYLCFLDDLKNDFHNNLLLLSCF